MRASIVVAAHNEGRRLSRTLAACVDSIVDLDYEIVVVDDSSFDGSVEAAAALFPQIRTVRNETRAGVSATKARGASEARGDVLVFLDGHTKPTHGAIERLVEVVERLNRNAVVTPQVVALDEEHWELDHSRVGNGYSLDLLTLDCGWQDLAAMRPVRESGLLLYESPALIGCALAVDRQLYAKVRGFDPHMLSWGVEDLDFGLKTWLLGHRILHDPQAVVGHRFRDTFDDYDVPPDNVLHNQIRTAVKNFSHTAAADWLEACRQRNNEPLDEHPEGLWARAWQLFGEQRGSAEQERGYLHARRTRDEIWYARRFRLDWPRLAGGAHAGPLVLPGSPSSGPSRGPSPSPTPCSVTGITPNTATMAVGASEQFTAQGANLSNVAWTTSPVGSPATGRGPAFSTKWSASGTKQVRANCGSTSATANVTVVAITPVITPADNFANRSTTRFGVGEVIALSFTATPNATAAQLGGLRWFITSGGGTLTGTGANNGTGTYTAPSAAGATTLQLKIASGAAAGTAVATTTITVVAPTDAHMSPQPGKNIAHVLNTYSVGAKLFIFLRPNDVSFRNVWFGEGTVNAVASGYLAHLNGTPHPPTPGVSVPCVGGNATTGTQVNGADEASVGLDGSLTAPFSNGNFLWAIPWNYGLTQPTATTTFTTANQQFTADAIGTAAVTKKDAGPFSKVPSDPTVNF
jgi:GT2 family glycosyltransferase